MPAGGVTVKATYKVMEVLVTINVVDAGGSPITAPVNVTVAGTTYSGVTNGQVITAKYNQTFNVTPGAGYTWHTNGMVASQGTVSGSTTKSWTTPNVGTATLTAYLQPNA